MKFQVVLEPSDEGGYTVYVPALPGCISEGESVEDALVNIQEAIDLYLEPVEDDCLSHFCVWDRATHSRGKAFPKAVSMATHRREANSCGQG
ncbi:MAG: type II toxin-antitoxin system HicB family antitoxin [Chloroflexi bacterium]|nr:type II toxin-antitoxin system HicB family antitoxin [Chloroflexota bacterium]